jgi:hypothetical protein
MLNMIAQARMAQTSIDQEETKQASKQDLQQ